MPGQTKRPSMTTQPDEHVASSCEMTGAGWRAVGLVGSAPAHAPSVAKPAMAQAERIIRADSLTMVIERSMREGASYVHRCRLTDRYAE